jgi:hypothetical protein
MGGVWSESAFTGGLAVSGGPPSVIEFQINIDDLREPAFLNIAVASAGRVFTRTAADVLGSDEVPADSADEVEISMFTRFEF